MTKKINLETDAILTIPAKAGKYSTTSELSIESKTTNETMKKVVTKSALGEYCVSLSQGKADFSKKAMMEKTNMDDNTVNNLYNSAADLMGKIALMMDAREAAKECAADTQGEKMVDNAERSVKAIAEDIFFWIAWKPGKKHKDKKGNTVTSKEPFYKMRKADYTIMGELYSEAKATAGDATVIERFTGLFLLMAGRILTGKPMGRTTAADLKAARAEAKKAIAEKAEKTRKKNAEKAAQESENNDVTLQAEANANELKLGHAVTLAKGIIDKVKSCHATDDEKKEILSLLAEIVNVK